MPLTPADIHNTIFGKSSLTRRGYDEDQVDALLDEVTQEMIKLLEENDDLRRRADLAQAAGIGAASSGGPDQAGVTAITGELERARRACGLAELNARSLRSQLDDARRTAAADPAAGRREPGNDGVLSMARRAAEEHLQDARSESERLLATAREQYERITEDARATARDIETDSQRRHRSAASELQDKHTSVLHEIDELTGLAKTYQTLLEDQIRRQAQL